MGRAHIPKFKDFIYPWFRADLAMSLVNLSSLDRAFLSLSFSVNNFREKYINNFRLGLRRRWIEVEQWENPKTITSWRDLLLLLLEVVINWWLFIYLPAAYFSLLIKWICIMLCYLYKMNRQLKGVEVRKTTTNTSLRSTNLIKSRSAAQIKVLSSDF